MNILTFPVNAAWYHNIISISFSAQNVNHLSPRSFKPMASLVN